MALMKLAVRNLLRNKRRTVITLTALVAGVGAMVAIKGFIGGQQRQILDNQMRGTLGALQVHKKGYVENVLGSPLTLDFADTPALRARIAAVPGVAAVSPRIEFGAQVSTPDKKPAPADGSDLPEADQGSASFLMMTAFDPALERHVTRKRWEWVKWGRGEMLQSAELEQVVLNEDFARGVEVPMWRSGTELPPIEQRLAVLAPDRDASLNGVNVVMVGTLASATPNDRRMGIMSLGPAQALLRMEGRVTEYGLDVAEGFDVNQTRDAVQAALGADFEVHTWEQRIPFVKDIIETEDFVFGVVSSIFLFVVLLGVVNAMLMSVLERVREIGTMLAVGMRRWRIVTLFISEGVVLGLIGGTLGALLGFAWVAWAESRGLSIPAPGANVPSIVRPHVDVSFLIRAVFQATAGAALASLWPAWRASRLRPVEALAHT
ncbi:MAG: ABC transporter permease [Myxococcus sp.]|nr:ABC transporter permease [Myxococcus sp.]